MTHGRLVTVPDEYAELVLVPALLHIDPLAFATYPPALREKMKRLMMHYIAYGGYSNGGG